MESFNGGYTVAWDGINSLQFCSAEQRLFEIEKKTRVLMKANGNIVNKKYHRGLLKKELNAHLKFLGADDLSSFLSKHRVRLTKLQEMFELLGQK